MLIEVFYDDLQVAIVNCPQREVDEALEYAFRWTQNIEGSWSRPDNADHNDRVIVVAPLPQRFGRVMGHRSSMVGDRFITEDGDAYICSPVGFAREVQS
jgi:hypothetical protein